MMAQARPRWDEERTTRGGEALLALQNRCGGGGRCVLVVGGRLVTEIYLCHACACQVSPTLSPLSRRL
jgi:hypothetical protein